MILLPLPTWLQILLFSFLLTSILKYSQNKDQRKKEEIQEVRKQQDKKIKDELALKKHVALERCFNIIGSKKFDPKFTSVAKPTISPIKRQQQRSLKRALWIWKRSLFFMKRKKRIKQRTVCTYLMVYRLKQTTFVVVYTLCCSLLMLCVVQGVIPFLLNMLPVDITWAHTWKEITYNDEKYFETLANILSTCFSLSIAVVTFSRMSIEQNSVVAFLFDCDRCGRGDGSCAISSGGSSGGVDDASEENIVARSLSFVAVDEEKKKKEKKKEEEKKVKKKERSVALGKMEVHTDGGTLHTLKIYSKEVVDEEEGAVYKDHKTAIEKIHKKKLG